MSKMRTRCRLVLCIYGLVGILLFSRFVKRYRPLYLDPTPCPPQLDRIYLGWETRSQLETIDMFTIVNGACAANQAVVLLKSLLYFQGRFQKNASACRWVLNRPSSIVCQHQTPEPYRPVRLHWVADIAARDRILSIFEDWHPADVHIYLYEYERYLRYLEAIPLRHYAGVSAMYKLLVPYMLPEDITKVIVHDSDMLFNYNVVELWKEFEHFKPNQAFGAVCEQIAACPYTCPTGDLPLPTFGVNGGLFLMNLSELRRINFWKLWQAEVMKEVQEYGYLPISEQKVINQLMSANPLLYHRLRCEWNVQIFKASGMHCCPIEWIDRLPDEVDCRNQSAPTARREPARLIHYNIKVKPEKCGQYTPSSLDFQAGQTEMTLKQLRHRYFQVYHKFRNMPTECLQ